MKLEEMAFEGTLKEINKISKDLEVLPDNFLIGDVSIKCWSTLKKVFISPVEGQEELIITPTKGMENIEISLSENKVKFDYNQRRYYVYGTPKKIMSNDPDLAEETPFYKRLR